MQQQTRPGYIERANGRYLNTPVANFHRYFCFKIFQFLQQIDPFLLVCCTLQMQKQCIFLIPAEAYDCVLIRQERLVTQAEVIGDNLFIIGGRFLTSYHQTCTDSALFIIMCIHKCTISERGHGFYRLGPRTAEGWREDSRRRLEIESQRLLLDTTPFASTCRCNAHMHIFPIMIIYPTIWSALA